MAAKNVAMGGPPLFQGVLQGARDVLLSDHLGEFLRTIFTRQDGVAHEWEKMIIRDARPSAHAETARRFSRASEVRRPRVGTQLQCPAYALPCANQISSNLAKSSAQAIG